MLRSVLGITPKERKRASWVRGQTIVKDILGKIKTEKGNWAEQVTRRRETNEERVLPTGHSEVSSVETGERRK